MNTQENLLKEINEMKQKLTDTASTDGLTGEKTLEISQALDVLLLQYQKISMGMS